MSRKIGLVVEGPTDRKFFEDSFKKQFPDMKGMKVIPSSTSRNQKIENKRALKNKIEDLRDKNCTEIYVLVDLDDNPCVVDFRDSFNSKMDLSRELDVTPIVVSTELEAWMFSALATSDKKTKEDLQKYFSIKSSKNLEENILKKFIASKENINPNNNQSLKYFLCKLKVLSSHPCK